MTATLYQILGMYAEHFRRCDQWIVDEAEWPDLLAIRDPHGRPIALDCNPDNRPMLLAMPVEFVPGAPLSMVKS